MLSLVNGHIRMIAITPKQEVLAKSTIPVPVVK